MAIIENWTHYIAALTMWFVSFKESQAISETQEDSGVLHVYCELLLILSFLCHFVDISRIPRGRYELSFIF